MKKKMYHLFMGLIWLFMAFAFNTHPTYIRGFVACIGVIHLIDIPLTSSKLKYEWDYKFFLYTGFGLLMSLVLLELNFHLS